MKTVRAINWKSSFKTRIGEMRTVRHLDVGKDFLKQDHVCWFILNLSGFHTVLEDGIFGFLGQPWGLVCRGLESLWNPGFFAICTECSPIYCVMSKCR